MDWYKSLINYRKPRMNSLKKAFKFLSYLIPEETGKVPNHVLELVYYIKMSHLLWTNGPYLYLFLQMENNNSYKIHICICAHTYQHKKTTLISVSMVADKGYTHQNHLGAFSKYLDRALNQT